MKNKATKKTTKKTIKKTVKKTTKSYNLLMYVENCTPKLKKFADMKDMQAFVEDFHKQYPEAEASTSGYWVDYVITDIKGKVYFFTDGISLE